MKFPAIYRGWIISVLAELARAQFYDFSNGVFLGDDLTAFTTNFSEVCVEDLGCFSNAPPFYHPIHRPISMLPQSREEVGVRMYLYTRASPRVPSIMKDGASVTVPQDFNVSKPMKIIIPGFLDAISFAAWMPRMKDEFLQQGDYNVIILDWSKGNGFPYVQAVANSRLVGAEVAHFLKILQVEHGLDPGIVHILGMSLGSQVAAYVGQRIPGLGRITGLDPAGPYFQMVSPEIRLDRSDALFVDVIHTNAAVNITQGMGSPELIGHVDFFPNGGSIQPSCRQRSFFSTLWQAGLVNSIMESVSCHHTISGDLMSASIGRSDCLPLGIACESWEDFENGECSDGQTVPFGLETNAHANSGTAGKRFFLKTGLHYPFCVRQYRVTLELGGQANETLDVDSIELLVPEQDNPLKLFNEMGKKLEFGKTISTVVASKLPLTLGEHLGIRWLPLRPFEPIPSALPLERLTIEPFLNSNERGSPRIYCRSSLRYLHKYFRHTLQSCPNLEE